MLKSLKGKLIANFIHKNDSYELVITFKNKTEHSNPIFDGLQILKFEHVFMLQLSAFVHQ